MAMSAVGTAVYTLLPLAMFVHSYCRGHIRDGRKIKKQVLLLPKGSGKTALTHKLSQQRQFLVVDVDEAMKDVCEDKEMSNYMSSLRKGLDHEADLCYTENALKVLAKTKERLKADKSLKVLFITSCYRFATHFKRDSILISAPNNEAFETSLGAKTPAEKEALRKARAVFISAVPNISAITTFKTHEQLEDAVRLRLGIHNVL